MNKLTKSSSAIPAAVLLALAGPALARDITIWDGNNVGTSSWYTGSTDNELRPVAPSYSGFPTYQAVREDQEVDASAEFPNLVQNQRWDLEAVLLSGVNMSVVGGYRWDGGTNAANQLSTNNSDANYLFPGDIFLNTVGAPNPTIGSVGSYQQLSNSISGGGLMFQYVIAFSGYERGLGSANAQGYIGNSGNYGFKVLKLTSNSTFVTGSTIDSSSPFRYVGEGASVYDATVANPLVVASGTVTYTGIAISDSAANTLVNAGNPGDFVNRTLEGDAQIGGASHYVMSLGLGGLFAYWGANDPTATLGAHLTMGCGNDEITAYLPPSNSTEVPDGSQSLILIGSALVIGFTLRRKIA